MSGGDLLGIEEGSHHGQNGIKSEERQSKRVKRSGGDTTLNGTSNILANNEDRYGNGTIVRIKLKQFVTYDYVEFFPGPDLNMIIGPNGTGKSTIVCAIALGLGGATSILGRAKDLSDFVKHGHEKATIEIELKRRGAKQNLVIQRRLLKANNTSTWKLNGKTAKATEVKDAIAALNVQVDNLCQFLPQDKVSEFAQMNPPQLLRETQRAAGETRMAEMHDKLIEIRSEEKLLAATVTEESSQLATLRERNEQLERDVMRFQERERLLKVIKILEMRIPWARYDIARNDYLAVRESRRMIHLELEDAQKGNGPLKEQLAQIVKELEQSEREKKANFTAYTKANAKLAEINEKADKAQNKVDELTAEIENIQRAEAKRARAVAETRQQIEQLQLNIAQLKQETLSPEQIQQKKDELDAKIHQYNRELAENNRAYDELQDKQRDFISEMNRLTGVVNSHQRQLKYLEDAKNQRLKPLSENWNRTDTLRAVHWIWEQEADEKFHGKVYSPIFAEIELKDKKMRRIIENVIPARLMTTIVCEDPRDYKFIADELFDNRRWKFNLMCPSPEGKNLNSYCKPIPDGDIKKLGFAGYAIDCIKGPDTILAVLCSSAGLHSTPVGLHDRVDHSRLENLNSIRTYIAGNTFYRIARNYNAVSVQSSVMSSGDRWLSDTVDTSAKTQVEREIVLLTEEINSIRESMEQLREKEKIIRQTDEHKRKMKEEAVRERREIGNGQKKLDRLNATIEAQELKLRNLEDKRISIPEKIADLKSQIESVNVKRGKFALEFKNHQIQAAELLMKHSLISLRSLQNFAQKTTLDSELMTRSARVRDVEARAAAIEREFAAAKARARELIENAKAAVEDATAEEKEQMDEYGEHTLEQLEEKLAEAKSRAAVIFRGDANVVQNYEARKVQIEALETKLQNKKARHERLKSDMETISAEWLPRLQNLIDRISAAFSAGFDRIGCSGEVKLSKHEDYDKWGIDILVKFRDHEKLQLLTGQRQSGGERSVSTILYLMALQELSKAPFRVVDEINQGMDPRNERLVHSQMVDIACRPGTSQYFLITPKLLPDLEYHTNMKILCIFNGEWLNLGDGFSIQNYLKNKLQGGQ